MMIARGPEDLHLWVHLKNWQSPQKSLQRNPQRSPQRIAFVTDLVHLKQVEHLIYICIFIFVVWIKQIQRLVKSSLETNFSWTWWIDETKRHKCTSCGKDFAVLDSHIDKNHLDETPQPTEVSQYKKNPA